MSEVTLRSTVTCPHCSKKTEETMPEDSCQYFWECPHCKKVVKAKEDDCCVFCSYGDTPCPPVQKT